MLMSMKRLNKEYCCSPSAKQYAHVLYELGISKEAVGETEKLFEEVPVLEETFASPVVPMREKLSSIDKIFPEEIKNFLKVVSVSYTHLDVYKRQHYVANGTLAISDFVICIILSLGIVGPLITVGSYTDDLGKIGVIVGEVAGILEQPELERPEKSKSVSKDNSVTLEDVRFGYHDKEILHGVTTVSYTHLFNLVICVRQYRNHAA